MSALALLADLVRRCARRLGDLPLLAVALLAERSAAGPPYPPELVAALSEFTQSPGDQTSVLDALATLGVGAHSSSDDDSD